MKIHPGTTDLVVFSHLRWDFVFQRPQHLLTRASQHRRVYFVEEPIFEENIAPTLDVTTRGDRLHVAVPHLPAGSSASEVESQLERLVQELIDNQVSRRYIAWYYTPMALKFTRTLKPATIVYDCMDELSNFKCAPPDIVQMEDELFRRAHVVFTGGISLYEYKCEKHPNIHPFPSSVDVAHFGKARTIASEPADQVRIPHPRIGYTGVIDERFDIELIRGVAAARPDWQLVMIGPVVKIDPESLPRAPNIHYLGSKSYDELPSYLAGWDAAVLPFARNDSTRFISPTKTPEYLAAGRRVVSTSIRDVVRTYGERSLVRIADEPDECVRAIEASLGERADDAQWLAKVDDFLSRLSWDRTFQAMWQLIESAAAEPAVRRRVATRSSLSVAPAAVFAAGEAAAPQSG